MSDSPKTRFDAIFDILARHDGIDSLEAVELTNDIEHALDELAVTDETTAYKRLPDRWKRCPSTHCSRRKQCVAPGMCAATAPEAT